MKPRPKVRKIPSVADTPWLVVTHLGVSFHQTWALAVDHALEEVADELLEVCS